MPQPNRLVLGSRGNESIHTIEGHRVHSSLQQEHVSKGSEQQMHAVQGMHIADEGMTAHLVTHKAEGTQLRPEIPNHHAAIQTA